MAMMASNGEKNGEKKVKYDINYDMLAEARVKLEKGETLSPKEFDQILTKTAKNFRERTLDAKKTGFEYVAKLVGISQSSLNSYYFTSFQILNKDMADKVHPYVAFTNALIHSIVLGYHLGSLDFDKEDDEPVTEDTSEAKPASTGKAKPKKARGKK